MQGKSIAFIMGKMIVAKERIKGMAIENLIENVDSQIVNIRTKNLDISFNELYDMYRNQELIISPDYQRLFRWEEEKRSRFIESLILEMPVPPIFVIEAEEGVYELIDGLQRISSYLHFRGEKLGDSNLEPLILQGCDIVPDLNGLSFSLLPKVLQIKIKRSFVRMEVIKKESEASLKYHMFKRLNTGGDLLSAQEIRNCTVRILGAKALDFLEKCSENRDFQKIVSRIGKEKEKLQYKQELVLRYLAMKNDLEDYKYPVTEYLTNYLEDITVGKREFNYEREGKIFQKTASFISEKFGENAFSGITKNGVYRNEFVLYYYDGLFVSVANWIDSILKYSDPDKVVDKLNEIKFGEHLRAYKTGSVNGVKTRIRLFMEGVQEILDS